MKDSAPSPDQGASNANPKSAWSEWIRERLHGIEGDVDQLWDKLGERMGWNTPRSLQAYTGWVAGRRVKFGCRVLATEVHGGPRDDDRWWDNLLNSYRRWNSKEIGGIEVHAEFHGRSVTVMADEEGYAWFDIAFESPLTGPYWQSAQLAVMGEQGEPGVVASCPVICPSASAQFGIISDMDDTVLHTGITSLVTAAKLTFLHNAKTRKALDGVAALYEALTNAAEASPADADPAVTSDAERSPTNPLFYVSSSPWNLYDLLRDFLSLNEIPAGPLRLRDLGIDEHKLVKSNGHGHKLIKARQIMDDYPELSFVLFGDSGQADAELYAELARDYPGRILAIFIRDVDPDTETDRDADVLGHLNQAMAAGVPAMLIQDSVAAAERLVELGLLDESKLAAIRAETLADVDRPSVSAAALS